MNWYGSSQVTDRGNMNDFGANEHVSRVLSEPGSINDWGDETKVDDGQYGETWSGQYGTRRYLKRDEDGNIISAILIGKKKSGRWQEMIFYTLPEYRRQGIARILYQRAVQDVGVLNKASEYSDLGVSFADQMRAEQEFSEKNKKL